ncbi:hypothetical protein PR048_027145 [Dryococelus australis]|uniref:Uncharacterized protein n=1 Tax=Dryococelus australis TaxID=614101 RepID=A0ABQ9GEL9_9NEOP|nr:hypothetical protein PR048_027145 [Dryococelus australis]
MTPEASRCWDPPSCHSPPEKYSSRVTSSVSSTDDLPMPVNLSPLSQGIPLACVGRSAAFTPSMSGYLVACLTRILRVIEGSFSSMVVQTHCKRAPVWFRNTSVSGMNPRANPTSKVKKRGSDTGDTNTHAQCLIAPTRKSCSVSVVTLYWVGINGRNGRTPRKPSGRVRQVSSQAKIGSDPAENGIQYTPSWEMNSLTATPSRPANYGVLRAGGRPPVGEKPTWVQHCIFSVATPIEFLRITTLLGAFTRCRGDVVVRLLASHPGKLVSIPNGAAPPPPRFLHVGIVPDDSAGRRVFTGGFRFPLPLHSGAAPHSPYFTLIGSRDLNIWNRSSVWHQNQHSSTSESRDIPPGKFRPRPKFPLVAADPHPYLAHERYQLKAMLQSIDSAVLCTNMPMSTVNWLSAVTLEGDDWASVLQRTVRLLGVRNTSHLDVIGITCLTWVTGSRERPVNIHNNKQPGTVNKADSFAALRIAPTLTIPIFAWLDYSPPTKANRVRFPTQSLPDLRTWESWLAMPLVGGFSRGYPVPLAFAFRAASCSIHFTLIGSQDLDVKSWPTLSTPLLYLQPDTMDEYSIVRNEDGTLFRGESGKVLLKRSEMSVTDEDSPTNICTSGFQKFSINVEQPIVKARQRLTHLYIRYIIISCLTQIRTLTETWGPIESFTSAARHTRGRNRKRNRQAN